MSATKPIVHVVDDDESFRAGVTRLLQAEGYDIRSYTSAADFLISPASAAPSCLLLDVNMPGPSGIDLQTALARQGLSIPIVFLMRRDDVPINVRAMKTSGVDFLAKPVEREALLAVVREAHARDMEARDAAKRLDTLQELYETLTPREREVFAGIVVGRLNKQIAGDIGAAERTVKRHRAQVLSKMRVRSVAELSRIATELGLVPAIARGQIVDSLLAVTTLQRPKVPAHLPPLRSPSNPPNNLPRQLTSFVGREKEIAQVKQLLGKTRLLTLTGTGGCGKTRLAIQVAADLVETYPDGVWLVEFASLSDPVLVPQTLATVLGLKEKPGMSLTQVLIEHLASRHVLLVLDNAEHLLAACAQLAEAALRQCPRLVMLVTSRERLGVAGELTYRVPSLSVPDAKRDAKPEHVTEYESARLFIERAQFQRPQFAVTRQNAPALALVCRRLDGIPLAIELAAARVRALSVEEVNEGLEQRFRLLTGGPSTALPRHQTLRSLIDWSYDLLSDAEKALLWRLSVFSGGWTLEAANKVCSGEGVDEEAVLDSVTALVDKSLAAAEERDGTTRYRLLETVRQYAQDRLSERGEEAQWRDRHLAYFQALAAEAEPHLTGTKQQAWLERLETEHDNLRVALVWSCTVSGNAAAGLQLAGGLWQFWYVRGYLGEGRSWFSRLLAAVPSATAGPERAKALNAAGALARQQSDYRSARTLHEESLSIFRNLGDRSGITTSLRHLGNVASNQGDYLSARALHEESLSIFRELGERRGISTSLSNLGSVIYYQGDYPYARVLFKESLSIFRELGDRWGVAALLNNLGNVTSAEGDYPSARALHEEGLSIFRELGERWGIAVSLEGLGYVLSALGRPGQAARIWGSAERLREEIGAPLTPSNRRRYDRALAGARAALRDDAAFDLAWREGRAMTLEEAVDYALKGKDD